MLTYALGTGYAEVAMLGVACEPTGTCDTPTGKCSSPSGKARPQGTPSDLAAATVEMIADCDPERCSRDGLALTLRGLTAA